MESEKLTVLGSWKLAQRSLKRSSKLKPMLDGELRRFRTLGFPIWPWTGGLRSCKQSKARDDRPSGDLEMRQVNRAYVIKEQKSAMVP